MPEKTLRAIADHGEVILTLDAVTAELEREGVESFCASYHQLLDCIEAKLTADRASRQRIAGRGI
jgi:hypothetical protein